MIELHPRGTSFPTQPKRAVRDNTHAQKPPPGKSKNVHPVAGLEHSRVLTTRAMGQQVEGAIGTGHPEMPPEHIARGLARLARKGQRSAIVREMNGVSVVLCRGIPAGTFALRTANQITAYSMETAAPIVTVPCGGAITAASNP